MAAASGSKSAFPIRIRAPDPKHWYRTNASRSLYSGIPLGFSHLHRTVQSFRQAHERDPGGLRGVPQAEAQVRQVVRERGEASLGTGAAQGREHR